MPFGVIMPDRALEHIPVGRNREGFPGLSESDSSWLLDGGQQGWDGRTRKTFGYAS